MTDQSSLLHGAPAASTGHDVLLRRQRALIELAALDKSNFADSIQHILRTGADTLGVERVNLWLLETAPLAIRCAGANANGRGNPEAGSVLFGTDYPHYFAALEKNPIIRADDAQSDARTSELTEAYLRPRGISSMMDVPVWVQGTVAGVLCHEHVGAPRSWALEECDFALAVGYIISMALEVRERIGAQTALRESQALFRLMVETVRDYAIVLLDANGTIVSSSSGVSAIYGYDTPEVIGRHIRLFYAEEGAAHDRSDSNLRASKEVGRHEDEAWHVRQDGRRFWANVLISALLDPSGTLRGFVHVTRDVSERRRAQEAERDLHRALETERARLRAVVEQMPAGVLIGDAESGRVLLANRQAEGIWGRPLEVAQPAAAHDEHGCAAEDAPRPSAGAWPLSGSILTGRVVIDEEVEIREAGAPNRTVLVRSAPIRDDQGTPIAGVVTLYDITAQKRAEEAERFLAEAGSLLSTALDLGSSLDRLSELATPRLSDWCVIEVDGEDTRLIGPADQRPQLDGTRRLLTSTAGSRRASSTTVLCAPGVNAAGQSAVHVADEPSLESQRRLMRQIGATAMAVVPLVARGHVVGQLTLASIDARRAWSDMDVRLAQRLAERASIAVDNALLYRKEQAAVRAREEVLAAVSHDLNNPLGAIVFNTEMLLGKNTADRHPDRVRRRALVIRRAAGRMSSLIRDLSDMDSIQAGRLRIEVASHDVRHLIRDGKEQCQEAAAAKSIRLVANSSAGDRIVRCDRERVLQVFANLIGNALKFSPAGTRLQLRARPRSGDVCFSVADRGCGIAPEDLTHVFDRHWSAKPQARKGSGLGLYISKGIICALGGEIWAKSTVGVGTTFFFTLPLAR